MTGDLQFSWELGGSGWAAYRIADTAAEQKHIVSYCTDALADLLFGVTGLYGTSSVQRVSFDLEPAEVRWRLRRRGADVYIAIYSFPDVSTSWDAPDGEGTLSWSSSQPRRVFSHAVMEAAQAVLSLHGEAGYLEKWHRYPFPVAALQDLRRLHQRDDECEQCQGSLDS
ncbi:hypothetical protein [Streptomyces sp. WAC01280]|uniref:hypothetical protein n=1 Tax=Streptomyces sp. WAC01280 TaxID=2487424 RepID=UPI000F78D8F4|nr:hypothetical protein [Streptomyces sp. WAC01280]RSS53236.1 hypothetical protein EF909_27445 [Streptomyces sp. WAC01280]